MYLCGHPGTGKTSSLNLVLEKIKKLDSGEDAFHLFMFNAMTYQDVKSFMITLQQDLVQKLTGKESKRLNRQEYSDEEITKMIVKNLAKLSSG